MESYSRMIKRIEREKVLPGFPIETPFKNLKDVKEYLSGDKIICLLCGKSYKSLNMHLIKTHKFSHSEYHIKYNIPWTYGLVCSSVSEKLSRSIKNSMQTGKLKPQTNEHMQKIRPLVGKNQVILGNGANFGEHSNTIYPMVQLDNGESISVTQYKKRFGMRMNSDEYRNHMREKGKNSPMIPILSKWWKGKSQTDDHIINRMRSWLKREWKPKVAS